MVYSKFYIDEVINIFFKYYKDVNYCKLVYEINILLFKSLIDFFIELIDLMLRFFWMNRYLIFKINWKDNKVGVFVLRGINFL